MLEVRGDGEPRGPWLTAPAGAPVVASALALTAVLAVVVIVAEVGGLSGVGFTDRVLSTVLYSSVAVGLVLAATVALSWSEPAPDDLAARPRIRLWTYDVLGVIAVAVASVSCWAFVDSLVHDFGGPGAPHPEIHRLSLAAVSLAPLFLAVAVIVVLARARRRGHPAVAAEAADSVGRGVFADGLVGPTIGCLLAAGLVFVAVAINQAFTQDAGSFGNRVALVSYRAGDVITAFLGFAVVVLLVLGHRHETRDRVVVRTAGIVGLIGAFVTIGGAYTIYWFVTAHKASGPTSLSFDTINWWMRVQSVAGALAGGVIGLVIVNIALRLRGPEPTADPVQWAPPVISPRPRPILNVGRNDARTIATMLAASTAAYAVFTALVLASSSQIAVNEAIAQTAPFVLTTAGLALAAALVMSAARPDVTGRDTLNDVFDGVVGLVAVAAFAVSLYSIWFVFFGRHSGRFSFLAQTGTAQRIQESGPSMAAVLIAAAAIHLIVRGRALEPVARVGEEPDDAVEALDLLS